MLPNLRQTYFIIFAGCTSLILTALYMQYQMGLHPCPLCVTQRIFVIVVGLIALAAALHNPKGFGNKIYSGLGLVSGLIGAGVSARHVWIQNLPEDQVPACGPGLEYMFETFPLFDALALLFQGDGNCADVVWSFLGLSIPAWTFVAFAGLVALCFWQGLRKA
ncbi:disulfide bond formation protein B [Simiduia curdlanivorans]|uniref:Disulfide bond formation protein B n=1 Tax=Simiduia curdlanivorans TaxID=1492769 RepID=A0ABV8V1K1_9GAMM|nr:disulfide bond formation protein B [Simiduia curdlanivorans]MDN3637895.1 disulfide bond formation protein B [Simiduia curdlanivorans]